MATSKTATSKIKSKDKQKATAAKKSVSSKKTTSKVAASKARAAKAPAKSAATRKPATKKTVAATKASASKPAAGRAKAPAAAVIGITRESGRYALPSHIKVEVPESYRPSAAEEYMDPRQLAYFRAKLREWRAQLVEESRQTIDNLRDEVRDVGDDAERATRETENSLELRTRDRYRKLIAKIDKALRRIEDGSYGYCEETDEEIGIDRLDARPIATLSLDAQERREHLRKQMGD